MAFAVPAARIGKTTGVRPRPANSEKRSVNARFHVASEVVAVPARKKKRKGMTGLINRAG